MPDYVLTPSSMRVRVINSFNLGVHTPETCTKTSFCQQFPKLLWSELLKFVSCLCASYYFREDERHFIFTLLTKKKKKKKKKEG